MLSQEIVSEEKEKSGAGSWWKIFLNWKSKNHARYFIKCREECGTAGRALEALPGAFKRNCKDFSRFEADCVGLERNVEDTWSF